MSKKPTTMYEIGSPLEDFKAIINSNFGLKFTTNIVEQRQKNNVEQALQRLEFIDNANPSEALKCLKKLGEYELQQGCLVEDLVVYDTIKQSLLKAQEMKKEYNDYGSARERWKIICQMIKRMFGFDIEEKWSDDDKVITQTLIKAQEQEKVLEIIKPLCEVVETPVKKLRYLKMNGVVVYTFKNKEEYDLLKRWLG